MTLHNLNRLSEREQKPRNIGLTMIIDTGIGIQLFRDYLELASDYIDYIKLGFGTLSLTPLQILKEKLKLAKEHQVALYPGGTFFECFAVEGKEEAYFQQLVEWGFTWVEISDGTIPLEANNRRQAIRTAKSMGLNVITEIGKKKEGYTVSLSQLAEQFWADLNEGARHIVIEGRESGKNIGVFNREGELDQRYVEWVHQAIPTHRLIWEAPRKSQQIQFIELLGTHANLGNISFKDILSLESFRRGLRSDTFYLEVE